MSIIHQKWNDGSSEKNQDMILQWYIHNSNPPLFPSWPRGISALSCGKTFQVKNDKDHKIFCQLNSKEWILFQ